MSVSAVIWSRSLLNGFTVILLDDTVQPNLKVSPEDQQRASLAWDSYRDQGIIAEAIEAVAGVRHFYIMSAQPLMVIETDQPVLSLNSPVVADALRVMRRYVVVSTFFAATRDQDGWVTITARWNQP